MKKIIIEVGIYFTQAAIVIDDRITDLYVEDHNSQSIVGNIYKGKVTNVLPGMQSIFVDVGTQKDVFVYVGDFQKVPDFLEDEFGPETPQPSQLLDIKKLFRVGNQIIIQIMKDPISTKGARGTPHLTLPGHFMVLMPHDNHTGVSRRIPSDEERARLKKISAGLNRENHGLIVRTAAAGKSEQELEHEYTWLSHLWQKICRKMEKKGMRTLIYREPGLPLKIIRDHYNDEISEIIINHREYYQEIREFLQFISPGKRVKLSLYEESEWGLPLFEEHGLDKELSNSLQRKIELKNGVSFIIEHTEALTAIDVNSGGYVGKKNLEETVFEVNKAAAVEIARQVRLRDIGGIIIIDFIDMKEKKHQEEIIRILNEGFAQDKGRVCIKGITEFGLVEITRKRTKNPLFETLTEPCSACSGSGRVASRKKIVDRIFSILKAKRTEMEKQKLVVSPEIYEFMLKNKLLKTINAATGLKLALSKDQSFGLSQFEIH
ncbi:MAG: Rne/Rng family ribonuclease [Candidatus Wallbacteria bacterium]|nr:Rne/Rng family ribonuclease [Candidatus Wallbacteria bacterium]